MKRTPLARKTRLQAKTAMKRGTKPLPTVNARQAKKRDARMRKWYSSSMYKWQRMESLQLAGHRCQFVSRVALSNAGGPPMDGEVRCRVTMNLHMHEIRYRFEHSTPHDRIILCKAHHDLVEQRDHPTRRHGRSA